MQEPVHLQGRTKVELLGLYVSSGASVSLLTAGILSGWSAKLWRATVR